MLPIIIVVVVIGIESKETFLKIQLKKSEQVLP